MAAGCSDAQEVGGLAVFVILISIVPVYLAHKLSSEVGSGGGAAAPAAPAARA